MRDLAAPILEVAIVVSESTNAGGLITIFEWIVYVSVAKVDQDFRGV